MSTLHLVTWFYKEVNYEPNWELNFIMDGHSTIEIKVIHYPDRLNKETRVVARNKLYTTLSIERMYRHNTILTEIQTDLSNFIKEIRAYVQLPEKKEESQ